MDEGGSEKMTLYWNSGEYALKPPITDAVFGGRNKSMGLMTGGNYHLRIKESTFSWNRSSWAGYFQNDDGNWVNLYQNADEGYEDENGNKYKWEGGKNGSWEKVGGETAPSRILSAMEEMELPEYKDSVVTLLGIADRQVREGNFSDAEVSIQLVITAESDPVLLADLWHRLAKLKFAQEKMTEAEQAARESNKLVGGNLPLKRNNWRLISEVCFELGDSVGAEQAARMVEALY